MFLTERIIGIITYMGSMLAFFFLIYHSDSNKKLKKYLIIYWILLAVLAFIYIPADSTDLSRLIKEMHRYDDVTFNELIKLIPKSHIPSEKLYFWVISKFNIDGLLPAITSMIFYGCIFTIVYKCAKKYNIDNKNIAISLLFFMEFGKFLEVISGIRSLMAFSIIALCIYMEIIENKKIIKNIPLYIFASFMHPAALVLTIIRMTFLLLQKEKGVLRKIINAILFIILGYITYKFANESIIVATEKAESYMNHHVYSYIWEYILSWIYIIFSTVTIFKYKNYYRENEEIYNIKKLIMIINVIIIILNFEYSIFSRFQTFSSILFIPIFSFTLQKMSEDNTINKKTYTYLFLVVSSLVFVIAGTRGNLSGYKFLFFN